MTEETTVPSTLTFNEQDYVIDDLSEKAKYILNQLQDLSTQASQLRAKLDQVEVASLGFKNILQEELDTTPEVVEESE